jgi:hypothetical protein
MKVIWNDILTAPTIEFTSTEKGLYTLLVIGSNNVSLHYWQQNISQVNAGTSVVFYSPLPSSKGVDSCTVLIYSQNNTTLFPILFVTAPNADLAKSRFKSQDLIMTNTYDFGWKIS